MTDYKALFVKYMAHLLAEEGYDYLNPYATDFTSDEMTELKAISAEASERLKAP